MVTDEAIGRLPQKGIVDVFHEGEITLRAREAAISAANAEVMHEHGLTKVSSFHRLHAYAQRLERHSRATCDALEVDILVGRIDGGMGAVSRTAALQQIKRLSR